MINAMRLGSSPGAAAAAAWPVCVVSGILGMCLGSYSGSEYRGSTSGPNASFAFASFSAALSEPDRNDDAEGNLSPPYAKSAIAALNVRVSQIMRNRRIGMSPDVHENENEEGAALHPLTVPYWVHSNNEAL